MMNPGDLKRAVAVATFGVGALGANMAAAGGISL
jgi:hypothetical protein